MGTNRKLNSVLKIIVSLSLGVGLVVYIYYSFSAEERSEIFGYFSQADYAWIGLSLVFAVLSHFSRAWRWGYTLKPMNLHPRFLNSFFAVMIGYITNLALPRVGEASRCAALARYEKMPFDKLLGTVIVERLADLITLFLIAITTIVFQFAQLQELLSQDAGILGAVQQGDKGLQGLTVGDMLSQKLPNMYILGAIGLVLLILGVATWIAIRKSQFSLFVKLRSLLSGLMEGVQSILTMKQKWEYIGHTLFIWLMYLMTFYVSFYSLPGLSHVPISGALLAFVMASFGFILVQGGLGTYPAMVMLSLAIYGVDLKAGFAFGWICWAAQTFIVIILGGLSIVLMPVYNTDKNITPGLSENLQKTEIK